MRLTTLPACGMMLMASLLFGSFHSALAGPAPAPRHAPAAAVNSSGPSTLQPGEDEDDEAEDSADASLEDRFAKPKDGGKSSDKGDSIEKHRGDAVLAEKGDSTAEGRSLSALIEKDDSAAPAKQTKAAAEKDSGGPRPSEPSAADNKAKKNRHSGGSRNTTTEKAKEGSDDKVNINTADAEDLADALNGIGPKKAEAIISYREKNGPFTNIEDLSKVKGIGPAIIKRNKDIIDF
ncbi:comEA protein [Biostraticola tofi]|uniref:ComEA protein n=2 Tax=Biostraticola tofi TaxID=466109 RepID=A0A4V2W448_9GAMM|nr:comEA protein [Biostraticola tofi]